MTALGRPRAGLRLIVLYKTIKASAELALVSIALALWPVGLPEVLHRIAAGLHRHVTSGWAVSLASWLEQTATARGVALSLIALGGDGILTGIEAWALWRGRWWGPWLVVLATGSLLPFDVYELARSPALARGVLFAANVALVAYLARAARREISTEGRSASR